MLFLQINTGRKTKLKIIRYAYCIPLAIITLMHILHLFYMYAKHIICCNI